jgi:hypoxanthine-DNA glycosylase
VLAVEMPADYELRKARVIASGVAIWDVLASCARATSLDADLELATATPNDFAAFFARHRALRRVFFNGARAEEIYRRRVLPGLPAGLALEYRRLPSTSPANAGIPYASKLRAWRALARSARDSGRSLTRRPAGTRGAARGARARP